MSTPGSHHPERLLGRQKGGHVYQPPQWMVVPLDFAILEELPPEGSTAGLVPVGMTVKGLTLKLNQGLTSTQIGGRIRIMTNHGLVVGITTLVAPQERPASHSSSQTKAYQVTKSGLDALRGWHSNQERASHLELVKGEEANDDDASSS